MNKKESFGKIALAGAFVAVFMIGALAFSVSKAKAETAPTAPSAPSGLSATAGKCGSGTVNLSWTDNSGGSAHFVVVRAGGTLSGKNSSNYQVKKGSSSYAVTGVAGNVWQKFYVASCAERYCSDLVGPAVINPAENCSSAKYSVTVDKKGSGSGTVIGKNGDNEIINCGSDCFEDSITYDKTNKIVLTATADSGSVFSKWEGDAECNNSKSPTCSLSRTKNHDGVKATFDKVGASSGDTVTLNISKNGTGSGTVELDDTSGTKTCDLSAGCSFSFKKNKKIFITVKPNSDSKVASLSGGVTNATNAKSSKCTVTGMDAKENCYITMSGNKSITINISAKSGITFSSSSSSSSWATADYTYSRSSVSDITSTTAKLNGKINPKGEDVEYYFQYYKKGDSAANVTATSKKTLTAGSGETSVSADISGLSPSTTYVPSMIMKGKTTSVGASAGLYSFTTASE